MRTTTDPFFRRLFVVGLLVLACYLVYAMSSVILPFVTAFILAYFFNPLVKWIEKFMSRWASILTVYAVISLSIVVVLSLLIPMLWEQLQKLWGQLQNAGDIIPVIMDWYNNTVRPNIQHYLKVALPEMSANPNAGNNNEIIEYIKTHYNVGDAQGIFSGVFSSSLTVINNAGIVVLIPILMFYFLLNWNERLDQWKSALPKAQKKTILQVVGECDKALMAFVRGQLLVMFLLGVIYAVQLQFIGLELGLIIGMIAGLASFVPYLGFGIGFISAIGAGLFQFGLDWVHLGLIAGAFMVGQMIEGYVLQPFLLGDKIGLSPLWVMFAVLAGAALLGFVGMLIALPVAAIINVLFSHAYERYLQSSWYQGKRQLRLFD